MGFFAIHAIPEYVVKHENHAGPQAEDYRALRVVAAEHDMSVSAFIRRIIADTIAKPEQEKAQSWS